MPPRRQARLAECLRVAKPDARMLCWAIPRTSHWTGTAIEDAGWIIEDRVSHLFGQGFPKAKSKLKPACEDWWLARKPGGKVPELQIDACRIGTHKEGDPDRFKGRPKITGSVLAQDEWSKTQFISGSINNNQGRWPANLVLSCCGSDPHEPDCPVRLLDEQSGELKSGKIEPHHCRHRNTTLNAYGEFDEPSLVSYGDSGGASRFFYCSKASRSDRGEGNTHPTVKPHDLMRWLCRLITPPGGTVLDPFLGSGSTALAALAEGFGFVGIELNPEYLAIAERRVAEAKADAPLFATA